MFGLTFEEEEARVKLLTCTEWGSLPRAASGESEIQKQVTVGVFLPFEGVPWAFFCKASEEEKMGKGGDRSGGRLIKSRL